MLRDKFGPDFLLVTPGIRSPEDDAGDQSRTMTPQQAIIAGSDYLVVGRRFTQAEDVNVVIAKFNNWIQEAERNT